MLSFAFLIRVLGSLGQVLPVVVFTGDQGVKVLEKNSVVPLGLVKNLLAHCSVQVLKESENFPLTQRNSLSLEFGLEHFCVDPLLQDESCLRSIQLVFFASLAAVSLALGAGKLTHFFNKSFLELLQLQVLAGRNAVAHVVSDVGGDHVGVNFEEVEVRQLLVHEVLHDRGNIDETAPVKVEVAQQLVINRFPQNNAVFVFQNPPELTWLDL